MMAEQRFRSAIEAAKKGHLNINTPYAAADLHDMICSKYDLVIDQVNVGNVDFALIDFGVKEVVFRLSFKPGSPIIMDCRHREAIDWIDCKLKNQNGDEVDMIMEAIDKYAFRKPPRPV